MRKYAKFAVLITLVIGAMVWLATANVSSSQTYYKTISELYQMGNQASQKKLRVAGDVQRGSIVHAADRTVFTLVQDKQQLKVCYTGHEPLPDTFRDGAQALADGRMGSDGTFQATQVQAKCASKYATKPGEAPAGLKPVNQASKSI